MFRMKKTTLKRLSVLILALTMCLMNMMTVFAANGDEAEHTYSLYQIFKGEVSNGVISPSSVTWGANAKNGTETVTVDSEVPSAVLADLEQVAGNTSDETKWSTISKYVDLTSTPVKTSDIGVFTNLEDGYYVVVDSIADQYTDGAVSYYVVGVTSGEIIVTPKADKPTVDKEVWESDDSADPQSATANSRTSKADDLNASNWQETADHAIEQVFSFRLTAQLPSSDLDKYDHYYMEFKDTISSGITYKGNLKVYVNDEEITGYRIENEPAIDGDGGEFQVVIDDLFKAVNPNLTSGAQLHGMKVTVVYDAVLNENAQVQSAGNSGDQGTTNVNDVSLVYSNKWDTDSKGETPKDYVWVFTYEMPNDKVDGSNNNAPLEKAGFILLNKTEDKVAIFDADGKFTKWETYDATAKLPAGAEIISKIADGDNKARFNFTGLDAGTYILRETTTPTGYNTCQDVTVEIAAAHYENTEREGVTKVHMIRDNKDTNQITIENNKGTLLPSTGGIGTTIFYVTGSIMVLGAAILLVVKKRMSAQ